MKLGMNEVHCTPPLRLGIFIVRKKENVVSSTLTVEHSRSSIVWQSSIFAAHIQLTPCKNNFLDKMASSKPILVYWDIRALAEPIRLLLNYLEVDFEDKRIPLGELGPALLEAWTSQKYSLGLDFPNLPYYVEGDLKITQSLAILTHLARKHNLYGDTLEDQARIDMVTQTVNDLRWGAWVVYNSPDFHEIKEEWKKSLPGKLGEMSKFLEEKEYVLGSKISFVDFLLYESMEWYRQFAMDVFEEAPELANLNQFQKRIEALPQIKAYMESDRFKDWPFFAPVVNFGFSKDPNFKAMPFSYRNFVAKYPLDPM